MYRRLFRIQYYVIFHHFIPYSDFIALQLHSFAGVSSIRPGVARSIRLFRHPLPRCRGCRARYKVNMFLNLIVCVGHCPKLEIDHNMFIPFIILIFQVTIQFKKFTRLHFRWDLVYLISIKICAPLIFAHLACTKIKGSKFAQYECAKIKGRRKNAMNE